MKAAVFTGLHQPLEIATLPDPAPGAGEVVIKVSRCGICGSDLHMAGDQAFGACSGDVFGHEFAGEVVALGRNVEGLASGDLVAVIPLKSCGQCDHCGRGEVQWCAHFGLQGGGYAEYALTHPNQCIRLPQGASLADGAIVEPLAVALHGVRLSGLKPGDKVLILGAGPIGLAVAFWARRMGAGRVVVQDIADWQLGRALAMGADEFVIGGENPACAATRALGGAGKADIVFECVGVPGLIAQAIKQVANRGTILLLGLCTRPDTFNSFAMLQKEARLVTSAFFTRADFEDALGALVAGATEPQLMISDTIALDAVPTVFEGLKRRTDQCKVLIAP
jgi:(R,R)-butanediol dehydrogenase/meso-butanediol dehydrogenase/diacetyl reductase